jgi:hypothetical protein
MRIVCRFNWFGLYLWFFIVGILSKADYRVNIIEGGSATQPFTPHTGQGLGYQTFHPTQSREAQGRGKPSPYILIRFPYFINTLFLRNAEIFLIIDDFRARALRIT